MKNTTSRNACGGFSLIEAVVAIAIVGLGMVGLLVSISSGTRANHEGRWGTQAVLLAREIREFTFFQPFDSLTDTFYDPPVDGQGAILHDLSDWQQKIAVSYHKADSLREIDPTETSNVKYVQAQISYEGRTIITVGWMVTRRQ